MVRSTFFLVSALLIVSSVLGNEVAQLTPPMTQMVLHDNIYSTIRTNVHRAHGSMFSGRFVGKYEKVGGMGSYNGDFKGTTNGKNTHATFKYKVDGTCNSMGFDVKYGGMVKGKFNVYGKRVSVNLGYTANMYGTAHGKKVKGDFKGKAYLQVRHGKFYYEERGVAKMYIAGKSLTAKYYATLNRDVVKVAVYGMYGGKKFFVKYSFSLNLLPLGMEMNPMMIKRNYGTVYINAGGKKFTQKYDMKGMQLPKLQ